MKKHPWGLLDRRAISNLLVAVLAISYYLGTCNNTGYYFYYEPEQVTVLDYQFLSTITEKSGSTVIYADRCSIGADKLVQMGIVFKKIPRDISRL